MCLFWWISPSTELLYIIPKKLRSINSWFVGVCVRDENGISQEGRNRPVYDFGAKSRFFSYTQPHPARERSRLQSFRSGAQHLVRDCIVGVKQHNFHPLSRISRRPRRELGRLSRSFRQFATKLRWFLLASFINRFFSIRIQRKSQKSSIISFSRSCVVIYRTIVQ